MTKTKATRETEDTVLDGGQRRAVLVTIEPSGIITLRLKGTRRPLHVGAAALYADLASRDAGLGATTATKRKRKAPTLVARGMLALGK